MAIVRARWSRTAPLSLTGKQPLKTVALVAGRPCQGAKLVVMPKAFVSAYPTGLDSGPGSAFDCQRVVMISDAIMKVLSRCPSSDCDRFWEDAAKEAEVYLGHRGYRA